ncbi:MAG: hypothetical protein K0R19_2217 [Bacillota bacterium]|nr:hypothetical protein [Bacillota bacterium]
MNGELSGGTNGVMNETKHGPVEPINQSQLEQKEPQTYYGIRKPEPMHFEAVDIILAFGMLVIGFLYWNLIRIDSLGLGVTLFAAVLWGAASVYFRISGIKQTRVSLLVSVIFLLSAVNCVLFDITLIKGLNFIFLSLSFVFWVLITAGKRLEQRISLYTISDMFQQLLVIPFANFSGCFSGIRRVFAKSKRGKGVLSGILGILIFLPVLVMVITLLSSADAAFEGIIDHIRFSVSENLFEYLFQMILGLPVACYLYGMLYGNRYQRNTGNITLESVNKNLESCRFAPGATVYSAMTALNLIYLVFFLAQASYLFSAFEGSLPQTMTYAEYARRGFFELCAVSAINLAVIAGAHLIAKRDRVKVLRGETIALCIFTIALLATAMSKMGMYISYYGLTQLRVYTSWFMVLLFVFFIIILLRQFKSFQGSRAALVSFLILFLALSYGNIDGLIAKYNIGRYQAGTLESVDLEAMSYLSDAAVPELYKLYQGTEDEDFKEDIKAAILGYLFEEHSGSVAADSFRDFNLQSYRADAIRNALTEAAAN